MRAETGDVPNRVGERREGEAQRRMIENLTDEEFVNPNLTFAPGEGVPVVL